MPKRFTDTEIWSKAWFRKLSPAEKSAWEYITNKCDNVGVWDADFELAEFCIGEKIDWDPFKDRTNGNIEVLPNGKWWLVDFVAFQHGDFSLDSNNHAHKSYVSLLVKHGLLERVKEALNRPLPGVSKGSSKAPKEKERAREKDRDREKEKDIKKAYEEQFDIFWELYPKKVAKAKTKTKWLSLKPDEKLFNEIMKGLQRYIQSEQWQKDNGQFIPHPTTFLNQERWKDDIGVKLPRSQIPICPGCGKSLENELRNKASHCYNSDCDADVSSITLKPP